MPIRPLSFLALGVLLLASCQSKRAREMNRSTVGQLPKQVIDLYDAGKVDGWMEIEADRNGWIQSIETDIELADVPDNIMAEENFNQNASSYTLYFATGTNLFFRAYVDSNSNEKHDSGDDDGQVGPLSQTALGTTIQADITIAFSAGGIVNRICARHWEASLPILLKSILPLSLLLSFTLLRMCNS